MAQRHSPTMLPSSTTQQSSACDPCNPLGVCHDGSARTIQEEAARLFEEGIRSLHFTSTGRVLQALRSFVCAHARPYDDLTLADVPPVITCVLSAKHTARLVQLYRDTTQATRQRLVSMPPALVEGDPGTVHGRQTLALLRACTHAAAHIAPDLARILSDDRREGQDSGASATRSPAPEAESTTMQQCERLAHERVVSLQRGQWLGAQAAAQDLVLMLCEHVEDHRATIRAAEADMSTRRAALEALHTAMADIEERALATDSDCQSLASQCDADLPRLRHWHAHVREDLHAVEARVEKEQAALSEQMKAAETERQRLLAQLGEVDRRLATLAAEAKHAQALLAARRAAVARATKLADEHDAALKELRAQVADTARFAQQLVDSMHLHASSVCKTVGRDMDAATQVRVDRLSRMHTALVCLWLQHRRDADAAARSACALKQELRQRRTAHINAQRDALALKADDIACDLQRLSAQLVEVMARQAKSVEQQGPLADEIARVAAQLRELGVQPVQPQEAYEHACHEEDRIWADHLADMLRTSALLSLQGQPHAKHKET